METSLSEQQITIICLAGPARSGKDTVASLLTTLHGFTRIALADGVRSLYRDLDGPTCELTKELDAAGKSHRSALQQIGTDCRERLPDSAAVCHWTSHLAVKVVYSAIHRPVQKTRFVVPDVRFAHEPEEIEIALRRTFGERLRVVTWRVVRPGAGLSGVEAQHKSEAEVDQLPASAYIHNNSTIAELAANVEIVLTHTLRAETLSPITVRFGDGLR